MRFGIFVYEGVEPIDLATFGVLSMARRVQPDIAICTIAPAAGLVHLSNGLKIIADHGIADAPPVDMLVVTGGPGWTDQATSEATLAYIRRSVAAGPVVSVCTGAMILAAAGVLRGVRATTKREVVPPEVSPLLRLRTEYPDILAEAAMLVDAGRIITGGGVSLCIDAMLHVLERRYGPSTASEVARIIEYSRAWAANRAQFPPLVV